MSRLDEALDVVYVCACSDALNVLRNSKTIDIEVYKSSSYYKLLNALEEAYPEKMKAIVDSYKKQDSPS